MTPTTCDFSKWPIVVFRLSVSTDKAQSDVVLNGLRDALKRAEPFTTITDLTNLGTDSKDTQAAYKLFMDDNRDALRRSCRGAALIVESNALRILANGFVLMARMPFPTRAFKNHEDATAWCAERLATKEAA